MDLKRFFEKRGFNVESVSGIPIVVVIDRPTEADQLYRQYSESCRTPIMFVQSEVKQESILAKNKESRLKKCLSTILGFLKFKKKA